MQDKKTEKEVNLDFKGLKFEEVIEDLLKVKPIENDDLVKDKLKKKKDKPKIKN